MMQTQPRLRTQQRHPRGRSRSLRHTSSPHSIFSWQSIRRMTWLHPTSRARTPPR